MKALIIDDNIALARVTQFALDRAGFETRTEHNGCAGLQAAQEELFDIIITDQQMPEMTGIELCSRLREMPEYFDCPIILLTAKGLELELPRLREELGISATFSKPFSPAAVLKAAHELTGAPV